MCSHIAWVCLEFAVHISQYCFSFTKKVLLQQVVQTTATTTTTTTTTTITAWQCMGQTFASHFMLRYGGVCGILHVLPSMQLFQSSVSFVLEQPSLSRTIVLLLLLEGDSMITGVLTKEDYVGHCLWIKWLFHTTSPTIHDWSLLYIYIYIYIYVFFPLYVWHVVLPVTLPVIMHRLHFGISECWLKPCPQYHCVA